MRAEPDNKSVCTREQTPFGYRFLPRYKTRWQCVISQATHTLNIFQRPSVGLTKTKRSRVGRDPKPSLNAFTSARRAGCEGASYRLLSAQMSACVYRVTTTSESHSILTPPAAFFLKLGLSLNITGYWSGWRKERKNKPTSPAEELPTVTLFLPQGPHPHSVKHGDLWQIGCREIKKPARHKRCSAARKRRASDCAMGAILKNASIIGLSKSDWLNKTHLNTIQLSSSNLASSVCSVDCTCLHLSLIPESQSWVSQLLKTVQRLLGCENLASVFLNKRFVSVSCYLLCFLFKHHLKERAWITFNLASKIICTTF